MLFVLRHWKGFFTIILLFILAILGLFLFQKWTTNRAEITAVVREIRLLNRWETTSFTIDKVIDQGSGGNVFQQFLFGDRILLIAHGEVIGGFDLSTVSNENVSINGSSITLTLPAPQILTTALDNAQTRVYDRQKGLLVPTDSNLESEARLSAEKAITSAACTEGILTNSSDNAKKQLTSLLTSLGYLTITITIPPGKCQ